MNIQMIQDARQVDVVHESKKQKMTTRVYVKVKYNYHNDSINLVPPSKVRTDVDDCVEK